MKITVVSTPAELNALRPQWRELHSRSPAASVFNSWEWQTAWWKWYGDGRPLHVLVASDNNAVAGILPCFVDTIRIFRLFEVRVLRNLGTGGDTSPDDLDALISPEHTDEVVKAFAEALAHTRNTWDMLELTDMAPDSALRSAVAKTLSQYSRKEGISARISYVPLPATWDAYLESLHRDRRYTIRKTRRKVLEQERARLFVWQDAAELDTAIERLIELHNKRWQERDESHSFSTPEYIGFHQEVMHACQANGWLRLYCLEIGGQIIAMYYCYRFHNRVYYFQGGFDPELSRLRPGLVLMGFAIQNAIEEGNDVFDMLRGEYDYKKQWAKSRRETLYLTIYRKTVGALMYRLRREWLPSLKHSLLGRRVQKRLGADVTKGQTRYAG